MTGLLTSIVPGLIYDDCNTVHLVLTTLQDKVLMNMSISKTAKLYTFNTPVVRSLFALYDWKGPVKWKPTKKNQSDEIEDINKVRKQQFYLSSLHCVYRAFSFLPFHCFRCNYQMSIYRKNVCLLCWDIVLPICMNTA